MQEVKRLRSVKGFKKGDRVLTSNSFGDSYTGTVDHFSTQTIGGHKMIFVHVKDKSGLVIGRNIKSVKNLEDIKESNEKK